MMNELSMERAIEILYTVRAYYASLTAGYPKGKDCKGIGDVMCSEIANSCLKAIKALEQYSCEDCISRAEALKVMCDNCPMYNCVCGCSSYRHIEKMPSVTPQHKMGRWIADVDKWGEIVTTVNGYRCSECNTFNTDKDNYCPNCGAKMEVEE